jgi:anti-anti-sigma regulatory factor
VVLALFGVLDRGAAPMVQRRLLRCLAEQPDAVICDLSGLEALDPGCATLFAGVAHRPRNRWPDSSVVLCCPPAAVAAVLRRLRPAHLLPCYPTVDQAIAHARSHPPFLREQLRLVPTLEAVDTARWFAAEVYRQWQLDEPSEAAQLAAGDLVADAVIHTSATVRPIELRMELRATGLLIAVQGGDGSSTRAREGTDPDPGSRFETVRRVAHAWGVRAQRDGSEVAWCELRDPFRAV